MLISDSQRVTSTKKSAVSGLSNRYYITATNQVKVPFLNLKLRDEATKKINDASESQLVKTRAWSVTGNVIFRERNGPFLQQEAFQASYSILQPGGNTLPYPQHFSPHCVP